MVALIVLHHVDKVLIFGHGKQNLDIEGAVFALFALAFQCVKEFLWFHAARLHNLLDFLLKQLAELVVHRRVSKHRQVKLFVMLSLAS